MSAFQPSLQMMYSAQQCTRVNTEACRSANSIPNMMGGMPGDMPMAAFGVSNQTIEEVPPPEKCIGQAILDWEFIHDLDLHLLKVTVAGKGQGKGGRQVLEPNPEPTPESASALSDLELSSLVDSATNELKLDANQRLETVVYYGSKVKKAADGSPEAVLQLDRNAAVHSHKPVENLYLTEKLAAGVYVVGAHNYSQRQLNPDVIGASADCKYNSFEDFQKADPGYQLMVNALKTQEDHVNDEDGTPEKIAIMTKGDQDMQKGSSMIQQQCNSGNDRFGVHYGLTMYTYINGGTTTMHPQATSVEELGTRFKADFFATSECVYNPEANPTGYNGANVLAAIGTEDGKLALSHQKAAHIALIKVVKEEEKSRIVEVRMLASKPQAQLATAGAGGRSSMDAFRRQQMAGAGNSLQMGEPFPEPSAMGGYGGMEQPQMSPLTSMQTSLDALMQTSMQQ